MAEAGELARTGLAGAARLLHAGRDRVVDGGRRAAQGEWAYAALTSVAPPAVPVSEAWKLSMGTLLGRHPRTPALAHKALGLLDGLGAVHLGPQGVGASTARRWSGARSSRSAPATPSS
ncbi:hypothetical protein ABIA32_000639 [Streptacidiphilus sp. MAP12-20]|uniref:hypothetical protein n=1 Tax=Streptacidiphilus sp. MAP12-20 TaxID=3156299 RepID=UPI003511C599